MYVQGTGVFARAAESSPVDSDRDQRMHRDIRRAIGRQNKLVPQGPRILLEKLLVVSSIHDFDFVRTAIQKATRNAIWHALAGDAFHLVVKFFEIL